MAGEAEKRKHFVLGANGTAEGFTSPQQVRDSSVNPRVNRRLHANGLLAQLAAVREAEQGIELRRAEHEIEQQEGLILEIEAPPEIELVLDSLDARSMGVELLAVKEKPNMVATVFVPHGKLKWLEERIRAFRDETTRTDKPKNAKLVSRIAAIRQAALKTFWTDDGDLFPGDGISIWWEVWLRVGRERQSILDSFVFNASKLGLNVRAGNVVEFIDRTVVLVRGKPEEMRESVELLDCIPPCQRDVRHFLASSSKYAGEKANTTWKRRIQAMAG